jgi:hypothetical protein
MISEICIRGPGTRPFVDGLANAEVRPACIADRGDPDPERGGEVARRFVERVREGLLGRSPEIDVADRHVGVAVEQAGQDRPAGEVQALVPVEPAPDIDDPAVLDDDVGRRRVGPRAVEHAGALENRPAHGSSPLEGR